MATTLTIDGVPKTLKAKSLNIAGPANGRATAAFHVISVDGTYRPALNDEVIIEEDGTRIFGGLVDIPTEKGTVGGAHVAITTEISAVDFNAYIEWRIISVAIPAGTLKAALTQLVDTYLDDYGVTLDAGQVDGPALPLLGYTVRSLRDVLDDIMKLTADAGEPFVWRVDEFKVLSAKQPSTNPAPFNVSGLPIPEVIGDVVVTSKRGPDYANNVTVYVPPTNQANRVETFTGDGSTTAFTLLYTLYGHRGLVSVDAVNETLSIGGGGTWDYDPITNTITRLSAPGVGAAIAITFDGSFTIVKNAFDLTEIAANGGIRDKVLTLPDIPDGTTAQAIADAELAKSKIPTQTAKYQTLEAGIRVGQSQTINIPRRNINTTGIVSDIVIRDFGKDRLIRDVTLTIDGSQTNIGKGWRDTPRRWLSDMSGGSSAAASSPATVGTGTPGGAGIPSAPVTSVQFNRSGAFGGAAEFTYNETTHCLVMGGGGSSITATDAESCVVFGYDCHITDP